MARIMLIEDDVIMAECIARAMNVLENEVQHFTNAFEAMVALDSQLPDVIVLDILLNGPDGFSFLNELISYEDTVKIPVIIITSLDLEQENLEHYGVCRVLQKETMTPAEIKASVNEVLSDAK